MPDWLLDTSIVSALMRGEPVVAARIASLPGAGVLSVSVITNAEIRYGICRMPAGQRRALIEKEYEACVPLFGPWLEVTCALSDRYAVLKAALEERGIILPDNDLWIAAGHPLAGLARARSDPGYE